MPHLPPANVEPLDVDGVRAITIGTGLWVIALVVLVAFHRTLAAQHRSWWITTAALGAALGALGVWYAVRRRNAIRAERSPGPPAPPA